MALDALNNALAGLDVTKARIDTISQNIANAQTPGYTDKTSNQTTTALGLVTLGPVLRNVSEQLAQSLNTTTGEVNQQQVTVTLLQQIETAFGTPAADSSLASAITNLQNAFQDLSVNPEQSTLFQTVIQQAQALATNLNSLSQTVSNTNVSATTQIQQAVSDANAAMKTIDSVNKQIVAAGATSDTTDLQDQRDQAIATLAGVMNITTYQKPNGEIAIYTADGKPLVDNQAATLSLNGSTVMWAVPPSQPASVRISSGTIAGLQSLQTTTLPAIQSQLDDIARALTVSFQNINVPLFNDGGNNPLLGSNPALPISIGNPANPTQVTGYAARIAVNQAIIATPTILRDANSATPLDPGDTTNIDAAVALFNSNSIAFNASTGLPATSSLVQAATNFVAAQSTARANAQTALSSTQSLQQSLQNQVSAQSGVNVDQEVAQLAVLQNTYSANARVLTTTQNIYSTLFNAIQ
jgi:flagellar hook-associated protein 1 FlgK